MTTAAAPAIRPITADDPEARSADVVAEHVERLRALFPEAFTEGRVDFAVLRQLLGGAVDDAPEKYGLTWHGKRRARQLALTPSTGTLRPRPEESVDWDATRNLVIEGDNLEVLKLLEKSYAGKVKLIYIDPPYNTGKDFVYPDDYRDSLANYLALTGQADAEGRRLGSNTEASGRFHTDWLNMIYPRLKVARSLLADTGVIMISIDDDEIGALRSVCDEVFGDENRVAVLIWDKQHSQQQGMFKQYHEYVLVYAKRSDLIGNIKGGEGQIDAGAQKKVSKANPASSFTFPAGTRFDAVDGTEFTGTYGDAEQVTVESGRLRCVGGKTAEKVTLSAGWTQRVQMQTWFAGQETIDSKGQKVVEFYFNSAGKLKCTKDRSSITPPSLLPEYGMVSAQTEYVADLLGANVFNNPKPVAMLSDFVRWFTRDGDLIVDFFAGSGTTGEAVWRVNSEVDENRRFLLVQLPEPLNPDVDEQLAGVMYCDTLGRSRNVAELTKERLRKASARFRNEVEGRESDFGFRVFELDTSNIRPWSPAPDDLAGTLLADADHLVPGRTEQDVLFELLLKLGLELTVPIEAEAVAGHTVHVVGAGALLACLTDRIARADAEPLALGIAALQARLAPAGGASVVFRDSAFADDVAKTNLAAILEQHGVDRARVRSL